MDEEFEQFDRITRRKSKDNPLNRKKISPYDMDRMFGGELCEDVE